MVENHVFNEAQKRLEPISRDCAFCGEGTMESMKDCYFKTIYKEQDRTNIIVYSSVKFSKIEIGIPRCAACAKIINKASNDSSTISSLLGVAIFIASLFIFDSAGAALFVGIFAAFIIGILAYYFLKNRFIDKAQIWTEAEAVDRDETINHLVVYRGWTTEQPTA
jgi:hypothetical protein